MKKHFFLCLFFLFGWWQWETWKLKVKPWRKWSPVAQAAAKAETELPKEKKNGARLFQLWSCGCFGKRNGKMLLFFLFVFDLTDFFFVTTKQFEGTLPLNAAVLLSYMWILPTIPIGEPWFAGRSWGSTSRTPWVDGFLNPSGKGSTFLLMTMHLPEKSIRRTSFFFDIFCHHIFFHLFKNSCLFFHLGRVTLTLQKLVRKCC